MSAEKTHWKKYMNPDYFGAWSLPAEADMTLTIDHVQMEDVTGHNGKVERLPVLHWKENHKPMVLNVTNSRTIESLYGTPYVEDWNGRKITLHRDYTKLKGEDVECVRIRPVVPQVKKKAFTPENPNWSKAVQNIANGEGTIQAIKKHYELTDEHEALLKKQITEIIEQKQQTETEDA